MSDTTYSAIGTRPVRHDGVDKVTGRANYGADLALPGMLFAVVVRSPHAHARIRSIDTSAALAVAGVKGVVTGRDVPLVDAKLGMGEGAMDLKDMSDNLLARDKVLYHGHAVAAVAATTMAAAQDAAALVRVEYEVLEPVMSVDRAMAPDAPILHETMVTHARPAVAHTGPTNIAGRMELRRGDVEQGFRDADVVVERVFRTPTSHQGYIEPLACVARVNEDGRISIWTSTQGPFLVRDATALILGIDAANIKVTPSEIGGGFGGKIPLYLEPLAVILARMTQRPVKMVMTRDEVFRASGPTSATKIRMKMGAMRDGTIVAASASLYYEAGAYRGSPSGAGAMCAFAPYRIPNFFVEAYDVVVNKPKVAAYRAPGSPMAALATESLVDEIGRALGMDLVEIRLKNAVTEGDLAPYGPPYGRIGFRDVLEKVRDSDHWKSPVPQGSGRGLACGFWFNAGMSSSATVMLGADGSAAVITGNPDIGGTRAAQALMVAEELGIPVERVRPSVADTDTAGFTEITAGSRVCYATGMAVVEASRDVREQLRARAAKIWGVPVDETRWERGAVVPVNPSEERQPLSVVDIAAKLVKTGGPIIGRASVNPPMAGPAFAAHICDLDVDLETGRSRVVRYTAVQDVGKAIHPSYVEGQMQGGASQGIGWALNEEYIYSEEGLMQNAGFLDYRMPVASDLPMIDTLLVEVPSPGHPYGVRGVGEVPIVPPLAAVANAMSNATGIRFTELPLSPPRVLERLSHGV
ncbi:MAG TPA: xanthine dehydrogenase family protein molybdopterin-binding subunit [Vicinamibacterales bacterium]|nr:xanthine dehydrogenase family protein molybdopterin-binding subunit [Vicinamibacterales bacterium]